MALQFVTCPCCYATSPMDPPHGIGRPCPTAIDLREAEISEMEARVALLEAQKDATVANTLATIEGRRR